MTTVRRYATAVCASGALALAVFGPANASATPSSGVEARTLAESTVDGVYPPGAPITEASGPGNVHVGRNLGPTPLVMWVLYIKPTGAPLSVDMPDPGCGFA